MLDKKPVVRCSCGNRAIAWSNKEKLRPLCHKCWMDLSVESKCFYERERIAAEYRTLYSNQGRG
jgi:hypothetical protein